MNTLAMNTRAMKTSTHSQPLSWPLAFIRRRADERQESAFAYPGSAFGYPRPTFGYPGSANAYSEAAFGYRARRAASGIERHRLMNRLISLPIKESVPC